MSIPDYARARRHLARRDPVLAGVIRRVGPCGLGQGDRRDLFQVLLGTIVSQQLSAKAAATIHGRIVALAGGGTPTPQAILALEPAALRAAGLSTRKVEYVRDLAARVAAGTLSRRHVAHLADEDVIKALTEVRGIGRWSAEMVLMFHLLRPDVLPLDDVSLLNAAQRVYGLRTRPTPARFTRLAEQWRPWRSVGCWYLWAAADDAST
jgi:DNA-3-methyladenine glycosylase II